MSGIMGGVAKLFTDEELARFPMDSGADDALFRHMLFHFTSPFAPKWTATFDSDGPGKMFSLGMFKAQMKMIYDLKPYYGPIPLT